MKIIPWIATLCVFSITHSAYGSGCFKDGFYAGLSFGANWTKADWRGLNVISLVDDIHDPNAVYKTWNWNSEGQIRKGGRVVGSGMFGYQFVDSRLYFAGQVSYTLGSSQTFCQNDKRKFTHLATLGLPPFSTVSGTSHLQAKVSFVRNEMNLDFKPGVLPCQNLLLYGRVGAALTITTQLKIQNLGRWTEMASETGLELIAKDTSCDIKNTVGLRAGGGIEYLLTEHLGISIDYIATYYGKIRTQAVAENAGFFDFNHVFGLSAPVVKVKGQDVMVGLIVHF